LTYGQGGAWPGASFGGRVTPEPMSPDTSASMATAQPLLARLPATPLRSSTARFVAGMLLIGVAYYAAAKLGQTLRYTASVAAIWPPVGFGIAALYLWGLRWWPGVVFGELLVNGELFVGDTALPLGSLLGQQAGNMAEIVVGAVLLRRLVGPGAGLQRTEQVAGILMTLVVATAISATFGTVSMLAGGVIESGHMLVFWRTWWLGDLAGGLVVLPALLAWARAPARAWRRVRSLEGALLVVAVSLLSVAAVSVDEPLIYVVFPALIWAALRFGPPGATLAIVIATGIVVGVTASEVGPFFKQAIDQRTLSTQVYIVVTSLTTLFLGAVVSERERSATELAEAKRHEGEQAMEERHRIARDLHDSVSQALFSMVLHTRAAQRSLRREGLSASDSLAGSLDEIAELTRSAQTEMRALIFELRREPVEDGLVAALAGHASMLDAKGIVTVVVEGPEDRLALSPHAEAQLFGIGREALANIVKHADARNASVRVQTAADRVLLQVRDDGRGFDPAASHPGHFGLDSMQSRATEVGGQLTITSAPGQGTVIAVEAPLDRVGGGNGV
jgi:signal transduction histidine kinase